MDRMILHEDGEILVVHKPAGIATETARVGQADVVSELKNYRARKGEDAYIGVVHRLDQPVEGLLVFAKTPQAAAALTRELMDGRLEKRYAALVDGEVLAGRGAVLVDYLVKDAHTNLSKVVDKDINGAKEARLRYEGVRTCLAGEPASAVSLVEITLFTGRHHQIRVQLSHAGLALLGDGKYGTAHSKALSRQIGIGNVALVANRLDFLHPADGRQMQFSIEAFESFQKIFK